MSATRILLIEVWFGPLPPWRPLFEATCRSNANLDFLLLTDQVTTACTRGNLRLEPCTREALEGRIATLAGKRLPIGRSWNLTSLKPAYGELFQEFVQPYGFWGYHDSDIAWGNTRRFLTEEILTRYDVVTASAAWVVGHFAIFRIGSPAERPHRLVPRYWEFFARENLKGVCLDEEILDHALGMEEGRGRLSVLRPQWALLDGLHPRWKNRAMENLARDSTGRGYALFEHGDAVWDGRSVYHLNSRREALYFHFQHWKRNYSRSTIAFGDSVAEVQFTPLRIAAKRLGSIAPRATLFWLRHEMPWKVVEGLRTAKASIARALGD